MDHRFPQQLFPAFYNCGPPDSVLRHTAGSWGSYDRVRPQESSGPLPSWTFTSRHQVRGEAWRHVEPVPVPLLSPKNAFPWPVKPPDPMDFKEHMQNFFVDHFQDAFGPMSEILGENFNFSFKRQRKEERSNQDSVKPRMLAYYLDLLKFKICQFSYPSRTLNRYSGLLWDVVHAVPPDLLGSLLYEELTEQRDRLLFSEGATGGALAFIPFLPSGEGGSSLNGCLLYPGNQGLDHLNFHKVELQHTQGGLPSVATTSSKPFSFQLKGTVRQISATSLFGDCCVGVRSDRLCGVWRFSEKKEPRLLQAVNTAGVATCISVSPHILGEVLVASESGAASLWTVGKGMQKVRSEDSNLYFNAKSAWRWCEFTAHPRVVLYADRTGAELTDIRVSPASGHTLFRISSTPECRSGERLLLSRYLGDTHSFHHLVATQYSAYVMDERFPCVPMLKWDHMMQSPPLFCHVVPGSPSSSRTAKLLLGSQSSQEVTLLQYAGGRAEACVSLGPPQALLRPKDSLKHLPVQIPHRMDTATNRLSSPAAGLTCIQKEAGRGGDGRECMCVLQLTEAGDIFYQLLEPEQLDADVSRPRVTEDEPKRPRRTLKEDAASGRKTARQLSGNSQLVVSDTSSDEGIVAPTQGLTTPWIVTETPERRRQGACSDTFSDDSEQEAKRHRKRLQLQVVVNNDSAREEDSGSDASGKDEADGAAEALGGPSQRKAPVKLSGSTLATWKIWLQKLMRKTCKKKPLPHRLQQFTVETKGLLRLSSKDGGGSSEKERVRSLRQELRSCMSRRSLLVHGDVPASLGTPDVVPVPNQVCTDEWVDPLSHRLTVSWKGEEEWRAWWNDQLGCNKEAKRQALKRKRRKEKEAKRAASRGYDLMGSFTSSVSYQSGLDDFSDGMGWSSGASQGAWSDTDGRGTLSQRVNTFDEDTSRAATPSTVHSETLVPAPSTTPQRVTPSDLQRTLGRTGTLPETPTPGPDSTLASQRKSKRQQDNYLSSLFASQDDPSQEDFPDGETFSQPPLSSSQIHSSQSGPRRSVRVDLSRTTFASLGSSQSLSLSQSSQGRLSQASQPKKKSRMGF